MYLKSLELFGFKSFPDRTVLNFDDGATVVVGPNGSGKSNISDAMRWVLGEISSRNIRGTKMEDVIFGGTDDRKQMNFAEVTVVFDNADRQMDIEYDEVSVTRRYYRKGESEYFINRKPVRLRDIHELFMNTGVGREGYSIIGQGRIAEIISRKSEDRRVIFEEAAGISKYRYKKDEAERKLQSVDDNLSRLNDILSELEGRVGPLERESEKARKYLEYYEIKKRDDVALWLYDMEKLLADLKTSEDALILSKNELAIAEEALATLESQNERLFEASQESKYQFEKIQNEIDQKIKESHELDNKLKLTENDITHRKGQIEDKKAADEKLAERCRVLENLLGEKKATLEAFSAQVAEILQALVGKESEEKELTAARAALSDKIEEELSEIKADEEKLVELRLRLSVLDTTEKNDSEKSASLTGEIEKYSASQSMLEERAERAEAAIAEYRENSDRLAAEAEKEKTAINELREKKQNLIDRSNEIYLDYTAKKHRIDAIRRMEELFEGYSQSVRFVMSEYEAGRISGTKPISDPSGGKIYGPVSRLIKVPSRYTLAIETALGANIQNIIVDDEPTAKAAINYLKQKNAGRATFYPISSMKPRYSQISDEECRRYAGYLGTADNVIEYDARFDGILRNLLGATVLFDTLDNASVMTKATGYKVRAVTLDGQIINAGGSFTGGSAKRDSGMLTRRTETEALQKEIETLSKSLDSMKRESDACEGEMASHNNRLADLSARGAMIASLMNAETTQLEVIKNQLGGERSMSESLKEDLERLKTDADERANNIADLKEETHRTEAKIEETKNRREEEALLLGSYDVRLDEIEHEKNELMIRRAEATKDAENAERELSETGERLSEEKQEKQENEAAILSLEKENEAAEASIADMKKETEALGALLQSLETERGETSAKNIEYEQKLNHLRSQMRDKSNVKEHCFRDFTLAENKFNNQNVERDKMTARLWEDYELTYTTAAECKYPPVTAETRQAILTEYTEYRGKLRSLGNVNLASIDEYTEVKNRYDFLTEQTGDLKKSKENLLDIIVKLEVEMRETFVTAFEEIGKNFKTVFAELFGGGTAELSLTDPNDVLTSGIEIRVAPPGKIIKSLTLLSGGEQAFVAIALIFAILRVNPTPFCIFDEIEAALDEANVFRFADYLKRYADKTQFIVITHRRGTMEIADRIYGVTMQERGISKVLALDINQAAEAIADDKA